MEQLAQERSAQVTVVKNTAGEITAFTVSNTHKKAVAQRTLELSTIADLSKFEKVIKAIEKRIKQKLPANLR